MINGNIIMGWQTVNKAEVAPDKSLYRIGGFCLMIQKLLIHQYFKILAVPRPVGDQQMFMTWFILTMVVQNNTMTNKIRGTSWLAPRSHCK